MFGFNTAKAISCVPFMKRKMGQVHLILWLPTFIFSYTLIPPTRPVYVASQWLKFAIHGHELRLLVL